MSRPREWAPRGIRNAWDRHAREVGSVAEASAAHLLPWRASIRMTNARVSSPGSRAMPRRAPPISQADETTKRLLFPRRSGRTAPMMTGSGSRLDPRALLVARARSHARTDAMRSTGARATAAAALALALASLVAGADAARASDPASPLRSWIGATRALPPGTPCTTPCSTSRRSSARDTAPTRAWRTSRTRARRPRRPWRARAIPAATGFVTASDPSARADGGAPLVTLAGPGLDADAAPGISLPDDDASRLVTSEFLRARCVAEADRVSVDGLIRAFNATAPESRRRPRGSSDPSVIDGVDLDDLSLTDDDDDDTHLPLDDARVAESSAAFAFALCVRGEWDTLPRAPAPRRGETAATGKPPRRRVSSPRRAQGARGDGRRARAAQEATFAFTRAAEETDENAEGEGSLGGSLGSLGGSLGAATRACARDAPALVAELRRRRARALRFELERVRFDSDSFDARSFGRFGLSEEEEVSARACARRRMRISRVAASYARKAGDAEMNGRGVSAAAAADTNRRAALRAYAAGRSTWPSSARSALAATRTARALVAENPNTASTRRWATVSDESSEDGRRRTVGGRFVGGRLVLIVLRQIAHRRGARGGVSRGGARPADPAGVWPRRICSSPPATTARRPDGCAFALYYLPFFGETAAAAVTRAGAAASSRRTDWRHISWRCRRARRRRRWRRQSAFDAATRARESAVARARGRRREPARGGRHGTHAEAPRERRGVVLAHASLADPYGGDERWSNAIAAADVVEKCDDATPPEERQRGDGGAREKHGGDGTVVAVAGGGVLALAAKGERGRATRAAWDVARAAEAKMDAATDEALMARVLGPKWRDIIRGAPENRAREGEL